MVAEGDRERQHTAARMAARRPGNGQSGNVAGRRDSVISHSGNVRRNVGLLMGKGRQCRADRTASFPLDCSLGGGKEAAVFRGVEKSRGQGACGGRTLLSLPPATLRAVRALTRAAGEHHTADFQMRSPTGPGVSEPGAPLPCVGFLPLHFLLFLKKKYILSS